MEILLLRNLVIFVISAVFLTRSAMFLVEALTKIGRYYKLREFATSFILMAFATSLPELSVSIMSAANHSPELAIGTVIGSNIASLTLVIGIAAIAAGKIMVKSAIKKKDIVYMSGIVLILILLMMDGTLSRPDAGILFMIYAYYIYNLFSHKKRPESKVIEVTRKEFSESLGIFVTSIIALILSAKILVWSVLGIGEMLSIPVTLIGIVVVALGTSLPDLSFELMAVREKHQDMVLGDIIGSVVTNSALVLGVVGMINPGNSLDLRSINTGLIFLALVTFGFLFFVKNDGKISTKEALVLVITYLTFVSLEYLVKIMEIW